AVEDADVVQPEKPALENISAVRIFAIDPPREIQQQLLKHPLEKTAIAHTAPFFLDLVDSPCRPGVHRWIHVPQRPLIGRQLTVGMHIPFAYKQDELLLG